MDNLKTLNDSALKNRAEAVAVALNWTGHDAGAVALELDHARRTGDTERAPFLVQTLQILNARIQTLNTDAAALNLELNRRRNLDQDTPESPFSF